jgi:small-conductance mechanosensitive channel
MQNMLNFSLFNNLFSDYLTAFSLFIGGMAGVYVLQYYLLKRLAQWTENTATMLDDMLVRAVEKSLLPLFYFGVLYFSLHTMTLTERLHHGLDIVATILITLVITKAAIAAVHVGLQSYGDQFKNEKQLQGVGGLVNFVIWVLALLFLLDNLGIKISAAVTGLGIGGIAVALAAQAVLGDLFSYFVIFFDKPFAVGDTIQVADKIGEVEHIGIKTTRIRALSGEQMVFSNTDLTNSRLHNFKRMEKRRVDFTLGMTYQTSAQKLREIPRIVKEIIEQQTNTEFSRGHFAKYGDFSLNFDFVYYVNSSDFNQYMDSHQAINLAIFEAFEREKIEFAYPSQTLFVRKVN